MSHAAQPVVVVGANGFVGRRVLQALAQTPGLRPVAAVRRLAPDSTIEQRLCDATDPAAVAAALTGAATVVNCVAGSADTMIAATHNVIAASHTPGLRRIVHISSMAVYGPATGLVEETHRLDPSGWYGEAKAACEALIANHIAAGNNAVILRPGCIHGPHSEQWTGRIARLLRHHRIGDLGAAGDGGCNLVHIDDMAAAVIAAIQHPDIDGEAFNLADPDPGTWNDYFMKFGRALGATPVTRISPRWLKLESKVLAIPLKLAQIAAAKAHMAAWAPDPIPGSLLAVWQQDIQLDHRRADARLGFRRTPPDQAITNAAAWQNARPA